MTVTATATILGVEELKDMFRVLPARVAQRVFDLWAMTQAQRVRDMARRSAPRDKNPKRSKPDSARLWKSMMASKARKLKQGTVSRTIAYSAKSRSRAATAAKINRAVASRVAKGYKGRRRTTPVTAAEVKTQAGHFHLVIKGNPITRPRRHKSGKSTGNMTINRGWWDRAAASSMSIAQGEVGAQLRDAFIAQMDREMKRMTRKYL